MTQWIITSSVLILIIAVLRFVLRGKISLKLQYALWGLVLIRLILPFSVFESPASVLNLMNERKESYTPPAYSEPYVPETVTPAVPDEDIFILDDNIEHIKPDTNIVVDDNGYITEPEIKVFDWGNVLMGVWLAGTAAFGVVFAVSNLRFRKKLKTTREYVPGTKAWLPVYESPVVKTPCLFGAVKPAIYVTKEVLEDEKVLSHVLEHETTHYRHGDHVWSVLRCICLAIHWYNPLVWLAAFLSMRDSELACDEDTIKRIGEEERIGYGRTLINLTCEKPAVGIISAATTMTGSKSSIKERIMLIAKKPKMLKITAALVAVIAVFAVGCTFTGAIKYNPKTTEKPVLETYSNVLFAEYSDINKAVRMKVTEASEKEITTEIFNGTSENVVYSIGYKLHFEQDGKWYELPVLDEETSDMRMAGTTLKVTPEMETSPFTNNIKESYGKLPDGKYRILRTFEYRGVSENSEAESFILAAEFVLEDGKLAAEYPAKLEEGEYFPVEQIFMNFASSFFGIPEEKYQIKQRAFVTFDSETGEEIELILVSEWKWQEFPYSAEEWKNLFIATETIPFPDISEYSSRYYQPLDNGKFIASLDGELWLVEIRPKKMSAPDDPWVWDIYRIVPMETAASEALEAEILEKAKTVINTSGADINSFKLEILDVESEKVPYEIIHYYFDGCGNRKYTVPVVGFSDGEIILVHLIRENEAVIHRFEENFDGEYEHKEDIPVEYEPIIPSLYYPMYTAEEIASMTEEEFFTAAKKLGYTDEQLEYIGGFIEEGLGREYILMPLEYSKETSFSGKTNDSKKSLGTFYYDPENFGDYGGSLGFAYVINNGKFTVLPEMYFNNLGVVDNEHFAFANDVSIKIYEFENINKPSAEWNLPTEDNTEFGYQLLGTSMNKTTGQIAVFYVDIPDDFDKIYDHKEPDLGSTYQIAVIDAGGNEVYTLDTGINLMVEFYGLPDCVRPEMGITYKNTLRFTLGEKSYEFNFEEKSLEKISPLTNFDSNDERVKEAISYIEYIEKKSGNSIISIEFSTERTDLEIEYLARYYDKEMLKDNIIHIKATYLDEIGAEDWTSYVLSYTELEGPYSTENYSNKYREEFGTQWYIINSGKP